MFRLNGNVLFNLIVNVWKCNICEYDFMYLKFLILGFGDRLLSELKKLVFKDIKIRVRIEIKVWN